MSELQDSIPGDPHDEKRIANVHPTDWQNPAPDGRYNLVVIGAGSAGLITAAVASGLGARVALVERHHLGGDCLNVGCVPSKGVIREGRRAFEARSAAAIGLPSSKPEDVDFRSAMAAMRRKRTEISAEDAASRYRDELGVEVFLGDARFTGSDSVEVDGQTLRFSKAVIATGARAAAPEIPGLADTGYLTNETVFSLTDRPRRLGVIGAGPIGCELAQALQRLGIQATLFEGKSHILTREDPDAAALVQESLVRDGVELVLECRIEGVARRGDEKIVTVECPAKGRRELAFDEILVAVGRAPNVEGLGLETVGVEYDPRKGVTVDDTLRTTNKRIWAAGDIAMKWKFTHAADAAAKIVVTNTLLPGWLPFGKRKLSSLVMPWCTYTEPELAHVGLHAEEARAAGIEVETFTVPLEKANRAVLDDATEGFVRVHARKGKGTIVGGTIVAANAGDMITQLTLAMIANVPLSKISSDVIYPYPTQSEAIKRVAGEYMRTRLSPGVKGIFDRLWRLQR